MKTKEHFFVQLSFHWLEESPRPITQLHVAKRMEGLCESECFSCTLVSILTYHVRLTHKK